MSGNRKVKFGSGYDYNYKRPPLENWKNMKEYYSKKGIDIGDYPVMTESEEKEISEIMANEKYNWEAVAYPKEN